MQKGSEHIAQRMKGACGEGLNNKNGVETVVTGKTVSQLQKRKHKIFGMR